MQLGRASLRFLTRNLKKVKIAGAILLAATGMRRKK
jgi:small neutral amino acid transporter SnatA (MarC family)